MRQNASDLVRRAQAGERVTITVAGRPAAVLGPVSLAPGASGTSLPACSTNPQTQDGQTIGISSTTPSPIHGLSGEPRHSRHQHPHRHRCNPDSRRTGHQRRQPRRAPVRCPNRETAEARAVRLARLSAIQRRFDPLPIDEAIADSYARLAARVIEVGRQPRATVIDLLIAATAHAHAHDAAVYTRNANDLAGLEELITIHTI